MTKPTRDWCSTERLWIPKMEKTSKKKIRCKKCGRLLQVNTCGWDDGIHDQEQYLAPHKGKYK